MLRIDKVKIENFRIYEEKEFDFSNNDFILLSGPNGYGKTTLLYAIEWCLTGNIGKLNNSYETRNSSNKEKGREDNKAGLIINKNALKKGEGAKVTLLLDCEGEKVIVSRNQDKEGIDNASELIVETGNISDKVKEVIQKISNDNSFYKYQMCDIQKVYKFLDKSRNEIKDEFIDFTKDRRDIDELINKLEEKEKIYLAQLFNIEADISKENEKLIKEKELQEKLIIGDGRENDAYPIMKFYDNEKCDFDSIDEAQTNIDNLKKCVINQANLMLEKIDNSLMCEKKKEEINGILKQIENNKKDINRIQKEKIYDNSFRSTLEKELLDLKKRETHISRGLLGSQQIFDFDNDVFNEYINKQKEYNSYEENIKNLNDEIELEQQGNDIIKVLSDIVANIDGIKHYRDNGNAKCPVCGSSQFNTLAEENMGDEAKIYLEKIKSDLDNKKKKKNTTVLKQKEINDEFTLKAKSIYEKIVKNKEDKVNEINLIWNTYSNLYNKIIGYNCIVDESEELIKTKLIKQVQELDKSILSNEKRIEYKKIINELIEMAEFNRITAKEDDLSREEIIRLRQELDDINLIYKDFNLNIYAQKIIYLRRYINIAQSTQYTNNIKKIKDSIEVMNKDFIKINENNNNTHSLLENIKKLKSDIQKEELSVVGEYIYNIYRKIIKHSDIKGIKLKKDSSKNIKDSGAVFTDESGNNLLNIMSDGQISIFVLSYFIGNIIRRKHETLIQSYFIDDITSCMDDLNMIAFVDLMKNMLNQEEKAIQQLFFSTCNHNIEMLFQNHMMGLKIPMQNLQFPN